MKKPLSILILVLLAIPLLTAAGLLISLRSRALDGEFWLSSLTDEGLLEGLTGLISLGGALPEDGGTAAAGALTGRVELGGWTFDAPSLSRGVKAAFPRDEYRKAVEAMVDAALEGKGGKEDPRLALDTFVDAFAGAGEAFAASYLEGLPEAEGIPARTDLSRKPKGLATDAFTRSVRPVLADAWEETLRDASGKAFPEGSLGPGQTLHPSLPDRPQAAVEGGIATTLLLGLLALVGSAFLYGGPWSGRLVLMGTGLILSSVAALAVGIALRLGADARQIINLIGKSGGPAIPADALAAADGLMAWAKAFFGALSGPFLTTGIVGMSLGALLLSMRWPLAAREE